MRELNIIVPHGTRKLLAGQSVKPQQNYTWEEFDIGAGQCGIEGARGEETATTEIAELISR